jgi:hypothetical protein
MNKVSGFSVRRSVCFALLLVLAAVVIWHSGAISAQSDFRAVAVKSDKLIESEVFRQFDAWVGQYLSGNYAVEGEFLKTGETLAARRRELFKQLIRSNPRAAIETAVPEKIQNRLPFSVAQFLEKNVSARGDYNVLAIDDWDSSNENANKHQIEREVVIGNSRYKAFVYGRKASMTTKLDIPLRGVVLDDLVAVDENSVKRIEPAEFALSGVETAKLAKNGIVAEAGGELNYFSSEKEFEIYVHDLETWESKLAPVRTDNLSPWTEGTKRLLFIRVDFPDRPGVPVDRFGQVLDEAFAQNLMDSPVNEFYFKNSYGKTAIRATVTPVVRMPQSQSVYTRSNLFALVTDARNAARAAGFETNNYELDMVAFSRSDLLDFSGISPIANKGALINGNFTFKVLTHELGHAYGLLHANLWRTFDGTITGNGENIEYGDDFDMMGRGATQATHFNAQYKRILDWLTDENVQTVTRPGVYRLYAYDTTAPSPQGIRVLKIKKNEAKDYSIEFRQQLTNYPSLMNGALIHWDYPQDFWRETQILDMNPATQSLDDAALIIGQTFTDIESGIKITVLGKGNTTPESLDIKVEFNFSVVKGAPFDFDGDNKSDIGVFRPSDAVWYLNNSSQGFSAARFGLETDVIAPAKFDGDRRTDIAVYRDGIWYLQNSSGGNLTIRFGLPGDIPVAADYDGDGYAELAVYRPSNGTWYFWNWVFQRFSAVQFGAAEDKPVAADYDGDGKTDVAVFRPSEGNWYLLRSEAGFAVAHFGVSTDKPVAADYDGDGRADIAVYRPAEGNWYLLQSTNGVGIAHWGIPIDIPVTGDYDGDGKSDLAVFRPADGNWYLLNSSNSSFTFTHFGLNGDSPVSAGFNP